MQPGPFVSPDTHDLRYNEARFKASHNSYDRAISIREQLRFDRDDPELHGFRGLELDVHQDTGGCDWCVRHEMGECARVERFGDAAPGVEGGCLSAWLTELRSWSDDDRSHDVITVTIDLKEVTRPETFRDDFDGVLRSVGFDDSRVFRPIEVTGHWPTLGEMRGLFVFCLSGMESVKSKYAMSSERLCFADISLEPGQRPPEGDPRLFININWRNFELGQGHTFERPTGRPYVVRAYSLRDDPALGSWDGAERAGVNVMATNLPRRLSVGNEPFARI